jgi:hypothetical protein
MTKFTVGVSNNCALIEIPTAGVPISIFLSLEELHEVNQLLSTIEALLVEKTKKQSGEALLIEKTKNRSGSNTL